MSKFICHEILVPWQMNYYQKFIPIHARHPIIRLQIWMNLPRNGGFEDINHKWWFEDTIYMTRKTREGGPPPLARLARRWGGGGGGGGGFSVIWNTARFFFNSVIQIRLQNSINFKISSGLEGTIHKWGFEVTIMNTENLNISFQLFSFSYKLGIAVEHLTTSPCCSSIFVICLSY